MVKGSKWTEEEIDILSEQYSIMGAVGIMKLLPNRTRGSIINKAKKLNLNNSYLKWTNEEEDKLRELFPFGTIEELTHYFPSRTSNSILGKARELKLTKDSSHIQETNRRVSTRWTEQEDRVLKEYYPTGGYKAVLEHLPYKNERSIVSRSSKLGIKRNDRYGRDWNRKIIELNDYGSDRKVVVNFTRQVKEDE